MELICRILPSFISLYIFFTYFSKKKDLFTKICYFAVNVIINNIIMMLIMYYVFKREYIEFSVLYSAKYLIMSSFIASLLPLLFKKYNKLVKFAKTMFDSNKDFSIKLFYKNYKYQILSLLFIVLNIIFGFIVDLSIRKEAIAVSDFNKIDAIGTNIFTLTYIILFIIIIHYLPKLVSKIVASIFYLFSIILFLTNIFLLRIKGEVLTLSELTNLGEGVKYLNFLGKEIDKKMILTTIVLIAIAIINIIILCNTKKLKQAKLNIIKIIIIVLLFICGIKVAVNKLEYTDDDWLNINYPKYYYLNMVNPKKSFTTMGLYEYTVKDFIKSFKGKFITYGSKKEIKRIFKSHERTNEKNKYTGIFKNKNLIMIMMESMDYAAIDKKSTPTLYRLMNKGWNFPNRYSALTTGGSTILTEYASMTGLVYNNLYFNRIMSNNYDYSLPNLFKKEGYTTSSFHENNGKYYNRDELHRIIGFDNSYFLYDMYKDIDYVCDTNNIKEKKTYYYCDQQFVDNKDLYNKLVKKDEKFMDLIVTMAGHGPYNRSNGLCEDLNDNELNCLKELAGRTDRLVDRLIKKLEDDNLLDDTVIILYTDHQAYGYNYPDSYLDTLTEIDPDKNIKNIPFIIYSKSLSNESFDEIFVNDIDLVPTIFNLFGIDFNPNYYIGTDLFYKKRENMLIFSDGSWYKDGIYSPQYTDSENDEFKKNSTYAYETMNLNNMILSNNYYKNISK